MTIVTAFYDINRKDLDSFKRDYKKYMQYFSFWAGLKNELIVYTSAEFKDEILEIRKKYALYDKTKVVVKELSSFDEYALKAMQKTFTDYDQSKNRKFPQNIECKSALYCYLMYLKPFFVCHAIENNLCSSTELLWLDFGFNHGSDFFTNSSQFNFLLQSQDSLARDKINFFSVKEKEENSIAYLYFCMETFLMGGILYASKDKWQIFKEDMKKALQHFLSFGIVDDDQLLFLWILRNLPQNYSVNKTKFWFDSLFYFMPYEFATKLDIKKIKVYKKIKTKLKKDLKQGDYLSFMKNFFLYFYFKFINKKEERLC